MKVVKQDNGSIVIYGPITHENQLVRVIPSDCEVLAIFDQEFFSGKLAAKLREFKKLKEVWLHCGVGRNAISHFLRMPNLEKLGVETLRSPGRRLRGFSEAGQLKEFRCSNSSCLTRSELHAITESNSIEALGFRDATIDQTTIKKIVSMPALTTLNLGDTNLDDELALILSKSSNITDLFIAGTDVASVGFSGICQMKQLTDLDAWATRISDSDLESLANLDNLKFLSIGERDEVETFSGKKVMGNISKLPTACRLWLDGIKFTEVEKQELRQKFDDVVISYAEPISD